MCCSAYHEDYYYEEAYAAGVDRFFTKPVIAGELSDAIQDAINT